MEVEKPHILVVDDEASPRESLKMILNPHYTVHVAEHGAEAVEMIGKVPVDLVTLDLKMPGLSGIRVLEKLKEHDPDIEAIIITGHSSQDTAIEGLRLGVFDYISKPFDVNHILSLVRRGLERRNAKAKFKQDPYDFLFKQLGTLANKIAAFAIIKSCGVGLALGVNLANIHDQTIFVRSLLAIVAIMAATIYSYGVVSCYRWAMSIDTTRQVLWRQATYGRVIIIWLFTLIPVIGLYARNLFGK
ncbi:MAG: response regulator [Candidatus Binatia bacterium]